MKRVMVIGCGGAGKSTFARRLGERTGLPVIHLDQLFWKPGWQHITKEQFDILHDREIEKDMWILDGNFMRTIPQRLSHCDTVVFLDFSRAVCLWGVLKRVFTNYGSVRVDMVEGCPERFDWQFLKWVWNFNADKRAAIYDLLGQTPHAKVIVLKNRTEADTFLKYL